MGSPSVSRKLKLHNAWVDFPDIEARRLGDFLSKAKFFLNFT